MKRKVNIGSSAKIVTSISSPENVGFQVRFDPQKFNSLIWDKGYEVWHDKALRCPCVVKGTGQGLSSCDNCLGIGWIFIDRKETRIAVQQLKADVKYENWSQTTAGMAKITSRSTDKLAFMDKIVLREVEGYFNEVLKVRDFQGKPTVYCTYEILEIESIFMFNGAKENLVKLQEGLDYTFDKFRITFNPKFKNIENMSITVRYRHYLTYHIIDMNRDIMKVRTKTCSMLNEELENMPISGMARKSHYLFDNLKFEESGRLLENS